MSRLRELVRALQNVHASRSSTPIIRAFAKGTCAFANGLTRLNLRLV